MLPTNLAAFQASGILLVTMQFKILCFHTPAQHEFWCYKAKRLSRITRNYPATVSNPNGIAHTSPGLSRKAGLH
jgi:hypothetical protein